MTADQAVYAFAGLWETRRPKDQPDAERFTIVSTEAQGRGRELHNRMPVFVQAAGFHAWLASKAAADELQAILDRASAEGLSTYKVSPQPRLCATRGRGQGGEARTMGRHVHRAVEHWRRRQG